MVRIDFSKMRQNALIFSLAPQYPPIFLAKPGSPQQTREVIALDMNLVNRTICKIHTAAIAECFAYWGQMSAIKRQKLPIRFRRFRRRSPQPMAKLAKNRQSAIATAATNKKGASFNAPIDINLSQIPEESVPLNWRI